MKTRRWVVCGTTAVVLAASMLGCGDQRVVRIDEGKVCVHTSDPQLQQRSGPDATYPGDAPVYLTVTLGCVSACIENEQAACTVTRSGNSLRVHSMHAYDPPAAGQGCIALCGTVEASCVSEPLPSGEYTLLHGDRAYPLVAPSTAERVCY